MSLGEESGTDSRWRERSAFVAVCLGFSVIALDLLAVNVALPSIRRDLGGPLSGLQWVVDGYVLAYASLLLTAGALGDRLGQRRVFFTGMALFGIASPLCSLAPNLTVLVGARVLQGAGAALLLPASFGIVANTYRDPVRRAHAIGFWTAAGSIAGLTGPALGGVLTDLLGWESIFWINVPVVLVALLLGWRSIEETPTNRDRKLDIPGQVLVVAAVGLLTVGLIEAGHLGWLATEVLAAFAAGALAAIGFAWVERRSAEPMLPLSLLTRPRIAATTASAGANMSATVGVIFALSLYLQDVKHYSPLMSGLALMPINAIGVPITILAGRVTARCGPRLPMTFGNLVAATGALTIALTASRGSPYLYVGLGLGVMGVGTSFAVPASMASVSVAAPREQVGLAGGLLNAVRQCGAAFGIAVLGSVLASSGSGGYRTAFFIAAATFVVAGLITARFLRVTIQSDSPALRPALASGGGSR